MEKIKFSIWKYTIDASTETIEIPMGSKFLCLKLQRGIPTMWFTVNPDNDLEQVKIRVFGTGGEIEHQGDGLDYLGTFLLHDGSLVLHVFKET